MLEANRHLQVVVKGNDLINARYTLTMTELKLVLCAIAQIQPDDDDFKLYEIDTRDYTDLTGSQNKGESTRLRSITLDLMKKPIELPTEDGYEQMNFISYAKYLFNQSKVQIRFDPAMKPYLLKLKKRFTRYKLHYVMQMQSYYSIRLYELLKQYAPIGRRVVDIEQLHDILQTPKSYRRFGNFRQRVLEPAQEEINDKTDISFTYETVKSGRSVSDIIFQITTKPITEGKLPDEDELPEAPDTGLLKQHLVTTFGLTSTQADAVLIKYVASYITEILGHVEQAQRKGKVRNLPAYTWKALQDDYRGGGEASPTLEEQEKPVTREIQKAQAELERLEGLFEQARDKAIAGLLTSYDLETLLEGFEVYLADSDPWLYNYVQQKALKAGESFDIKKHYRDAYVQFKTFLAIGYLPKQYHSFEFWQERVPEAGKASTRSPLLSGTV